MPALLLAPLVAFVLFAPGALVAALRKQTDWLTFVSDAVLYAALIDSAIYWLPLHAVPLAAYTGALAIAAAAGAVAVVFVARRLGRPRIRGPLHGVLVSAVGLSLLAYAVIGLVRAQIDWDAINYYLFTAVGFASEGHVSSFQPHAITIGDGLPMAFPPVLPTMYAIALTLAGWLHGTPDGAVRLIPFCFLCGTVAATMRLCRRFVPGIEPAAAGLAVLMMPVTINYMIAQALSLDMLNAFAFALLMVEVTSDERSAWSGARMGLAASLTIMSKVTGPLLVAFAVAGVLPRLVGTRVARGLACVTAAMLFASTWFVDRAATASPWFYVACALLAGACVSASRRVDSPSAPSLARLAGAVVALVPAAAYLAGVVAKFGSPATFYIGSLMSSHAPNFAWANATIAAANVFDSQDLPGLPALYGVDVFFWWGTALAGLLAVAGTVFAVRARASICALVIPMTLFQLSFLTLFQEGDFRRLLPTAPFVALLAAYGATRLPAFRRAPAVWIAIVCGLGFPYAWTAQQTIFAAPLDILTGLGFDQWHATGPTALQNTVLYVIMLAFAAAAVALVLGLDRDALFRFLGERRTAIAAIAALAVGVLAAYACTSLFVALDPRPALALFVPGALALAGAAWLVAGRTAAPDGVRRFLLWAAAPSLVILVFEPVCATAASPGFSAWATQVVRAQYYGYLPELDDVTRTQHDGSVLTFEAYGVSWFSKGQLRRLELTDAYDLGALRPALAQRNRDAFLRTLQRYGVRSAILPSPDGPLRPEYDRLVEAAGIQALTLLDDPQVAVRRSTYAWTTYRILPAPSPRVAGWASAAAAQRPGERAVSAIRVRVAPSHAGGSLGSTVYAVVYGAPRGKAATGSSIAIVHANAAQDGDIVVPLDTVARAAALQDPPASIEVAAVEANFAEGDLVWHPQEFSAMRAGGGWVLAGGTPWFASTADLVPVVRVRVGDAAQSGGVEVYPPPVAHFGDPAMLAPGLSGGAPVVALALAASDACPAGTPYAVTLTGSIAPKSDSNAEARKQRVLLRANAVAGGDSQFDLYNAFAEIEPPAVFELETLRFQTGRGPCASATTLTFRHLELERTSSEAYGFAATPVSPEVTFARGR